MGQGVDLLELREQGIGYYLLLRLASLNNATELRDKVYAMHGIFNIFGIPMPDPDYTKKVADVWEEATFSIIQRTGSLIIISAAGSSQNQYCLPSWVLDWSSKNEQLNLISPGLYRASRAAGQSIASCDSSRPQGKLDLTGILFAKIKVRGPSMVPVPNLNDFDMFFRDEIDRARIFSAWVRIAFRIENMAGLLCDNDEWFSKVFLSQDVSGEHSLIAFYRTLTRDKIPGTMNFKNWRSAFMAWTVSMLCVPSIAHYSQSEDLLALYDSLPWNSVGSVESPFWRFWSNNRTARDVIPVRNFDEACRFAKKFHDEMKLIHEQQTFFLTTTGHMGIANYMVQEDDLVALFAGGNFPMIIRPDSEHYRLISPSYIDGIMQGEAWPADVPFEEMKKFTLI